MTTYTISGTANQTGGSAGLAGTWTVGIYSSNGVAFDGASDWRAGAQPYDTLDDGTLEVTLPETDGTDYLYQARFESADRSVRLGPFLFDLTADKTWQDVIEHPTVVPPTISMVTLAEEYRDEAQGYAEQASAAASLAAWTPSHAYTAGDIVRAPDGSTIKRRSSGTSRSSFDATEQALWDSVLVVTGSVDQSAIATKVSTPVDALITWGDSLTADPYGTSPTWTDELGTELGIAAVNHGIGGSASSDIAMWQGAINPPISVTGNTIPTTGSVTATLPDSTNSFREQALNAPGNVYTWTGYIQDTDGTRIAGTLTHTQLVSGAITWSFAASGLAAPRTISAGAFFHCTDGDTHLNDIHVFWVGRNNVYGVDTSEGVTLDDVPRDLDLMIRHLPVGARYVILGPPAAPEDTIGTARWTALDKVNSTLARRYGSRYVDIWRFQVQRGMLLAGLAPTGADRTAIANDTVPPQLQQSGGGVHYNEFGSDNVRMVVREKIKELGHLPGSLPQVTRIARPAAPTFASTTSSGTTATVTGLDANAVAAALYYRRTGSSDTWLATYAVPSAGSASFTVTDMLPGTSYDTYVVASTVFYDSAVGAIAPVVTTGTPPTVITSDRFTGGATTSISGRSTDVGLGGTAKTWTASGVGIDTDGYAYNVNTGSRIATIDTGVSDHGVSVKMIAFQNVAAALQLRARYTDGNNYYAVNVGQTGAFTLLKRVASSNTTLISGGSIAPGQTLKLSVVGTAIKVYVDGVQVMSVTDSGLTTGTNTQISFPSGGTTGRVDDFVVTNF